MSKAESTSWDHWREAVRGPEVQADFARIYDDLSKAIAEYGPTCWASGRCCKFESFGHRLYVTGLEIAYFRHRLFSQEPERRDSDCSSIALTQLNADKPADACRYQKAGQCSVHAIRPLGCRIFFCQQGTEQWQQKTYERFHEQVAALHEQRSIPYHYMEWRHGLIEADRHGLASI